MQAEDKDVPGQEEHRAQGSGFCQGWARRRVGERLGARGESRCFKSHIRTHARTRTRVHTHTRTRVHTHTCTHAHVHACMHVNTHAHTAAHRQRADKACYPPGFITTLNIFVCLPQLRAKT